MTQTEQTAPVAAPELVFAGRPHHLGKLHGELVAAVRSAGSALPPEHLRVESVGDEVRLLYDAPRPVPPRRRAPPGPPPEAPARPPRQATDPAVWQAYAAALERHQTALAAHTAALQAQGTADAAYAAALAQYDADLAAYEQQVKDVWEPLVPVLTAAVQAHDPSPPPAKANPLRDLTDAQIDADPRAALKALVRYWRRREGIPMP